MKTTICGGREYHFTEEDKEYLKTLGITHVVSGGARGADTDAIQWAKDNNIPFTIKEAKWDDVDSPTAVVKYRGGKPCDITAGFKRNEEMAKISEAVVAFPGNKGTAHMLKMAKKYNLKIFTKQ